MSTQRVRLLVVIAVVVLAAGCAKKSAPRLPVRVVTTPEIAATGLVSHLASAFATQTPGAHIAVAPLEASAVLDEAKRGLVDVVLTNDPPTVAALRAAGVVRLSSMVATDGYLVVGPSRNPAHVSRSGDEREAFRRIFTRRQRFCSFVDVAPLHDRELRIWSAVSIQPGKNRHYRECTGDALAAFRKASSAGMYTLVDRATFDAVQPEHITTFVRGGSLLVNDVTALQIERRKRPKDAEWFMEWLMSYRGRDAIDSYRVNGSKRWYVER